MKYDSFEIAMLIKEIYACTIGIVSDSLRESGFTHQQVMVIKLIAHNKKITITQLCEEMSLAKGTVSGIVTRLEQAGLVEKLKAENDKRNTYITFSPKGEELAKSFRHDMNQGFDKIFENFAEEEVREVKAQLLKFRDKLKQR